MTRHPRPGQPLRRADPRTGHPRPPAAARRPGHPALALDALSLRGSPPGARRPSPGLSPRAVVSGSTADA